MKEGRIWLYVSPSVGLPLFFLTFVTASLLVHASVMTHTTWVAAFWQGGAKVAAAPVAAAPVAAAAVAAAPTTDAMATNGAAQ